MAALGAVTLRNPAITRTTLEPITAYTVERGNFLGPITLRSPLTTQADYLPTVALYLVRQLSIVYRQIWPPHGQRFPQ